VEDTQPGGGSCAGCCIYSSVSCTTTCPLHPVECSLAPILQSEPPMLRLLSSCSADAGQCSNMWPVTPWRPCHGTAQVNARLGEEERRSGASSSGDPAFPKIQWPSVALCPGCR
jgi:hypothetical protein